MAKTNLAAIPPHVLKDVCEFVNENNLVRKLCGANSSIDTFGFIEKYMSAEEIIDAYLSWNGIIGYTGRIIDLVHSVDKAVKQIPEPMTGDEAIKAGFATPVK